MYRMIVDKGDWDELVATIIEKSKQIEEMRKVLLNICKKFEEHKDSAEYIAAQKYL